MGKLLGVSFKIAGSGEIFEVWIFISEILVTVFLINTLGISGTLLEIFQILQRKMLKFIRKSGIF